MFKYTDVNVTTVSANTIPKSLDAALDARPSISRPAPVGVSIRHGPADDSMDIDVPEMNGTGKRKSRGSIGKPVYKDASSDEEDEPLVRFTSLNTRLFKHYIELC